MKEPVNIKGTKSGIILVLDPDLPWEELMEAVKTKFNKSRKFFGNGSVALAFEGRKMTDEEKFSVANVVSENSDLNVVCITEEDAGKEEFLKKALNDKLAALNSNTGKFYKGTLRNGQVVDFETSIIILGDVNAGAQVVSKGSIIVLGSIYGNAFAGAGGSKNVFVAALNMNPTQIRIGDSIARASDSDGKPSKNTGPMIAFFEDGNIYVEPISRESLNDLHLDQIYLWSNINMGEVIVITSGKGGVGKTTTTANLGTGLAKMGKSVVLIDTDIGLRNLDVVMGLENRIVYNLVDVIEGTCRINQALIKDKRNPSLYLLPSAQTKDKTAVSPEQMRKLAEELKEKFDYILMDCPAGIEQGFQNAIAGATRALVVTTPEVSAIRDADRIIGLLDAAEMDRTDLIVNRLRADMVKKEEMMSSDDVVEVLGINLIGVVPDDENIVISTNKGEPLVGSDTLAGKAYMNICRRILGEEVPMLDLYRKDGFMSKLVSKFKKKELK